MGGLILEYYCILFKINLNLPSIECLTVVIVKNGKNQINRILAQLNPAHCFRHRVHFCAVDFFARHGIKGKSRVNVVDIGDELKEIGNFVK